MDTQDKDLKIKIYYDIMLKSDGILYVKKKEKHDVL